MSKTVVGDIFEIKTSNGAGYFQYVQEDKSKGGLIQVFNHLFSKRPTIEEILSIEDTYFVSFPLLPAIRKKLVEPIGHSRLIHFEPPKYMRQKHVIRAELLGWFIIDTKTWQRELKRDISNEELSFSPWGVWNDTLLKECLEKGWSLNNWR